MDHDTEDISEKIGYPAPRVWRQRSHDVHHKGFRFSDCLTKNLDSSLARFLGLLPEEELGCDLKDLAEPQ